MENQQRYIKTHAHHQTEAYDDQADRYLRIEQALRPLILSQPTDQALEQMIVEVKSLLGAEGASVLRCTSGSNRLIFAAVATPEAKSLIGTKLPANAGIANWALQDHRAVWLNEVQGNPNFYGGIDAQTGLITYSILAVPMLFQEKPMGVIEVVNKIDAPFTSEDAKILQLIAPTAAIVIANAHLQAETQQSTHQLTVLHELDQAISSSLRLGDVFHTFALHAARLLPYDYLFITLLANGETSLSYANPEAGLPWSIGEQWPRRNSIVSWVTAHGQPLLRHNVAASLRFAEDRKLAEMGIESTLSLPLRVQSKVIGALHLGSREKVAYHPDDLNIAQSMADQLAISVENARLFQQVRTGQTQLKTLAQQIVAAQEQERQRLSRELHDEAGQALTALKIGLELMRNDVPLNAPSLNNQIDEAVALTQMTLEQLRLLARDLRPPALDTAGLDPTLAGLCREFSRRTKIKVDYTAQNVPPEPLPDLVNICFYRFLQESLTNIAKHAQAQQVTVILHYYPAKVSLTVQDDGQGFDTAGTHSKGIGLLGLQERLELLGGALEIEAKPGQGTQLRGHVPFEVS